MTRHVVEWQLTVTSFDVAGHEASAAKVRADADARAAETGEEWIVSEIPALLRVSAVLRTAVDDLDDAA